MSGEQIHIPAAGFLRLPQVLRLVPVGRSSWWRGVKAGRYPRGIKIAPRTTAWKTADILALLAELGETEELTTGNGGKK